MRQSLVYINSGNLSKRSDCLVPFSWNIFINLLTNLLTNVETGKTMTIFLFYFSVICFDVSHFVNIVTLKVFKVT